mgnify:CR=1 FL=1
MGSHSRYADRYPKSYSLFSGRGKFVDGYDNSVRYVTASFKASLKKSIITPIFKDFFTCLTMEKIQNQEMPILLINLPFKWFEFPFWSILVLRQLSIVQKSKKNCKTQRSSWTNDLAYNLVLCQMLGCPTTKSPFRNSARHLPSSFFANFT